MAAQRSDVEASAGRDAGTGPTYPPPQPHGLSPVLERNIRALQLRRYRSLSAVARSITGTQWSGPLFFGLRKTGSGG
jgi:hypothetical protein